MIWSALRWWRWIGVQRGHVSVDLVLVHRRPFAPVDAFDAGDKWAIGVILKTDIALAPVVACAPIVIVTQIIIWARRSPSLGQHFL